MQMVELPAPLVQFFLALLSGCVFGYAKWVSGRLDRVEQSNQEQRERIARLESKS